MKKDFMKYIDVFFSMIAFIYILVFIIGIIFILQMIITIKKRRMEIRKHKNILHKVYTHDTCGICLEESGDKYALLCGHIFHKECIEQATENTGKCIVCNVSLS
jgi:hypothetical protein